MFKKILFTLPLVVVLGVACTSGGEEPAARVAEETPSASPAALATATEEPSEAAAALAGVMNPLGMLGGTFLGEGAAPSGSGQDVDPDLKAPLLEDEDLPPGYSSFGPMEMSFTLSDEDLGFPGAGDVAMEMAVAYFFEGDIEGGDMGSMVMSMVAALPEEMMDEAVASFEEFDEEALQASLEEAPEMPWFEFKEIGALDASGLGEDGAGMHVVMDLGGMGFGEIPGGELFAGDIAFDMYMFVRDGKMLMLMTMWPGEEGPSVDSRSLAEIMDRRASGGF